MVVVAVLAAAAFLSRRDYLYPFLFGGAGCTYFESERLLEDAGGHCFESFKSILRGHSGYPASICRRPDVRLGHDLRGGLCARWCSAPRSGCSYSRMAHPVSRGAAGCGQAPSAALHHNVLKREKICGCVRDERVCYRGPGFYLPGGLNTERLLPLQDRPGSDILFQ